MQNTIIDTQAGKVISMNMEARYVDDPLALFHTITADRDNVLLLESAEINSKHHEKSLLLIDAAVKLTCNGNQVEIAFLSANGRALMPLLAQAQFANCQVTQGTDKLVLQFTSLDNNIDEEQRLKADNAFSPLRYLCQQLQQDADNPFAVFLGGVFGYDMIAVYEDLPDVAAGTNHCPDYQFYLAESLIVIDHKQQQTQIIGNVFTGDNAYQAYFAIAQRLGQLKALADNPYRLPLPEAKLVDDEINIDCDDDTFRQHVVNLKQHIVDGDIFQVVPSRTFSLPCPSPMRAYQRLKTLNPSPYMFYMRDSAFELFGASPESALKYQSHNNDVEVYPIAGTRKRGFLANGELHHDLDSRIELELREDEKEKAEHLMLVDLARNDIARVAKPGSRHVAELLKVDRYSFVMHLVSRVKGQLREDLDALHAYQACMNMGTLVGAPKLKAAALIREVEQKRRGSYGGAVGYMTGQRDMDTCIIIRSAFVSDGIAQVQAGAGVVFDSDPQSEADETRSKAQAVLTAIRQSHNQEANA